LKAQKETAAAAAAAAAAVTKVYTYYILAATAVATYRIKMLVNQLHQQL